jgi:hypothetical protein
LFENLHSFKVAEASDLISWLDFLLDNLFLCFGHGVYRHCIGIPMGTNCAVYLVNFYLLQPPKKKPNTRPTLGLNILQRDQIWADLFVAFVVIPVKAVLLICLNCNSMHALSENHVPKM